MIQRFAKCPVCGKKTKLSFDKSILDSAQRFPYTVKVEHKDHYFYVNFDSQALITDILHPEMVE